MSTALREGFGNLICEPSFGGFKSSKFDFEPVNMLIYCDPPYKSTQRYSTGQFDSELFWNTMRKWSEQNVVFISEQIAPSDFEIVWTK